MTLSLTTALVGSSKLAGAATSIPVFTEWRMLSEKDGLPNDSIRAVSIIRDQVWIGTDDGAAFLGEPNGDGWNAIDFPRSPVVSIAGDPVSHDVWMGTAGRGLFRFTAGRLDHFHQLNSGLAGDIVFSVVVHGGRVWAATNGGVSEYDPIAERWALHLARRADGEQVFAASVLLVGDELCAAVSDARGSRTPAGASWRLQSITGGWEVSMPIPGSRLGDGVSPPLVTSDGTTVCAADARRSTIHCADDPFRDNRWHQARSVELGEGVGLRALWVGDMRLAAESRTIHVLGDEGVDLAYSSSFPGGAVRACRIRDGALEECRELSGRWRDGRIRCVAVGRGDLWVGTTRGLLHGYSLAPWSALRDVPPSVRPENAGRSEPVVTAEHANIEPKPGEPRAIGVFGPGGRSIALPGSTPAAPGRGHRPDDDAIGYCIGLRAQTGAEPLDLVTASPGYSRYGWGLPEDAIGELAADSRVEGIVGNALETPWVTAATIDAVEVPWMHVSEHYADGLGVPGGSQWIFQCLGDEPRQHRMLFATIVQRTSPRRIAVLRDSDGLWSVRSKWWAELAAHQGLAVSTDVRMFMDDKTEFEGLATLRRFDPDVVFLWTDGKSMAKTVSALRASGLTALVIAGPALLDPDFLDESSCRIGPAVALLTRDATRDSAARRIFDADYRRWRAESARGAPPTSLTFRSFLSCNHLLDALDSTSGRERVRNLLVEREVDVHGEEHFEARFPGGCASLVWLDHNSCAVEEICPD